MFDFREVSSLIAKIFSTCIEFLDFSFLNKFSTVPLALPLSLQTILLSLALNAFGTNSLDYLVIFNKKINGIVILLNLWMKHQ